MIDKGKDKDKFANLVKWDGKRAGYFDSYQLRLNHLESATALWIQYDILSPVDGDPYVVLLAAFFDYNVSGNNFMLRSVSPVEDLHFVRDRLRVSIGDAVLEDWGACGALTDKEKKQLIEWDLRWKTPGRVFLPMGRDHYEKDSDEAMMAVPGPRVDVRGVFVANGRPYDCNTSPACQVHLWGAKREQTWAWANCNTFESKRGDPLVFNALLGRTKLGPMRGPAFSILSFDYDGKVYTFNTARKLFRTGSKSDTGSWSFRAEGEGIRFEGQVRSSFDSLIGMQVGNTDGKNLWAYRTGVADMNVEVERREGGAWEFVDNFVSRGTTGVEWGYDSPDERLKNQS